MNRTLQVLSLIFCFALSAAGQQPQWQKNFVIDKVQDRFEDLQSHLYIYQEKENGAPGFDDFFSKSLYEKFLPFPEVHITHKPAVHWGLITFENRTGTDLNDWVLYTGEGNYIDVYVFSEDGIQVDHQRTGQWLPAKFKEIKVANREERVHLTIPANSDRKVFIRVETVAFRAPDFDLSLHKEDFYKAWSFRRLNMAHGFFLGFMATMFLFNFFTFIASRDRAYLYQGLFVLAVTIFMFQDLGILSDMAVLRNYPISHLVITYSALALINITYIQFIRYYTDLKNVFAEWDVFLKRMLSVNIAIWGLILIYFLATKSVYHCDIVWALLFAFQYGAILILMVKLVKARDKKNYFLAASSVAFIVDVLANGASVLLNFGINVDLTQTLLGVMIVLFFLGLAYRMRHLREEEQEALRLKVINELKNKLYTNITHEFRTPLTVIKGMAEEIRENPSQLTNGMAKKAINAIRFNADRLLNLVNRLLGLAKIESGQMEVDMKNGDIIGFLRYLVQSFDSYAKSHKLHLQFISGLTELHMDFDADKIQQIVSNLISNAIKFTPPNGKIFFSAEVIHDFGTEKLLCKIRDTGQGVSPEELPHLFERFYQAESSKAKNQGTGIGLALTKELVHLMGGKIEVESELLKGTTFSFELPVTQDAAVTENFAKTEIVVDGDLLPSSYQFIGPDMLNCTEGIDAPHLLIIEDNTDIVYFLKTILESDYEIATAFNGEEGIEAAFEIIPDIILCDVMMPVKDGYEVLESVKNDPRTSHIPVVMLTAKASTDDRIDGLSRGADAYLSKPFQKRELFAILKNMVLLRQRYQERYANALPIENAPEATPSEQFEDAFLIQIKQLLEANIEDEHFGIPQICRALRMSRTQLHRKLKALTGKSTSLFIRSVRLHKAKVMLQSPDLNISEVAYAVGYSDPAYFTNCFTEEFGRPPSAFQH